MRRPEAILRGVDERARTWHQELAAELFNRCWDLIDKDPRTSDEDAEMLLLASTSRWHWGQVGGPEQIATGDWQVGHVAALLGHVDLAVAFAGRSLDTAVAQGWDGWRLASAHEGMARACACAGDDEGRSRHLALGRAALEREEDADNRQAIAGQLDAVPPADRP